jgi:hypothetical protein
MRSSFLGWSSSAVWFVGLAVAAGCSHSHEGPQADEYVIDCETGGDGGLVTASDENFRTFINAEAAGTWMTAPADKLPVWVSPTAGSTLSATAPPTFTFSAMTTAARETAPRASAGGRLARACPAPPAASFWRRLASELAPIRRAEAHCPPVSGQKYLLRLATPAGVPVYTATLSVTSFTPDPAVWSRRLAGHQRETLTTTLVRALFSGDDIGEGPFVAAGTPTLTVGP